MDEKKDLLTWPFLYNISFNPCCMTKTMKILKINKSNILFFYRQYTAPRNVCYFPSLYVKTWNKRILTPKSLCKKRTPKTWVRDNQEVLLIYWHDCFEWNKKTNSDESSVPWNLRAWSFGFITYTVNATLGLALFNQELICVSLEKHSPDISLRCGVGSGVDVF